MVLNDLFCADVLLKNYSPTHFIVYLCIFDAFMT